MYTSKSSYGKVLTIFLCAALTACQLSPQQNVPFFETALVENMPVLRPVRAISGFDCMDTLLKQQTIESTYVTSKIIPDASGKVYVSIKDVIIKALLFDVLSQSAAQNDPFALTEMGIDAERVSQKKVAEPYYQRAEKEGSQLAAKKLQRLMQNHDLVTTAVPYKQPLKY